jgi:mycothiol synthase
VNLTWRTLTRDDSAAMAELCAAVEAVDDEGESYGTEDIEADFDSPSVDETQGSRGGFLDGRLVVAGMLFARTAADPVHQMFFWGMVHPDFRRRGHGTALTEWALDAAARISEERFPGAPGELRFDVDEKHTGALALVRKCGFTARHYEFGMEATLAGREPGSRLPPEGFALVGFSPSLSEEIRQTHNIAFVPDHPGSTVATVETWPRQILHEGTSFHADLSFSLRDERTGLLAGYLIAQYYEADTAATGLRDIYLAYIGTRREYRGRGVASTLIRAALDGAVEAGFDSASLQVLAENPTGALGVYERAGFTVRRRYIAHSRALKQGTMGDS